MTPTGAQPLGNLALLAADEPPAFEIVNAQGSADAVLVCDHASNRIPRELASLGLTPDQLLQHIAWDPGAAEVARGLATRIDAPLFLSGYSRLVIDLNRPLASPESIPEQSAGVPVSGNCGLTPQARDGRVAALFAPYHQAISDLLERRAGQPTLLISIHSFTPVLGDERRPWPISVAYGRDRRLADLLRPALELRGDLLVGNNQPYGVDDEHDYTLPTHGEGRGIPHAMIELRQDGLSTPAHVSAWVERLATAYKHLQAHAVGLFAGP